MNTPSLLHGPSRPHRWCQVDALTLWSSGCSGPSEPSESEVSSLSAPDQKAARLNTTVGSKRAKEAADSQGKLVNRSAVLMNSVHVNTFNVKNDIYQDVVKS